MNSKEILYGFHEDLSLRDYIAIEVLKELIALNKQSATDNVTKAYEYADLMLKNHLE